MIDQEKALKDLQMIKTIMEEATNKVIGNRGLFFILFGIPWLVAGIMFSMPAFLQTFEAYPIVMVTLWLAFVLACTVGLNIYANNYQRRHPEEQFYYGKRVQRQIGEIVATTLVVGFAATWLTKYIGLDRAAQQFMLHLVMFLTNIIFWYFCGVIWAPEFRVIGVIMFAGMVLMTFCTSCRATMFPISFGLGSILAGVFMRRRWLKLKREQELRATDE